MGRGKNLERNSWIRLPLDTFHLPFEYLDTNKNKYLQKMYRQDEKNFKKKLSVCPIKSYTFDTFNHLPLDGFFRPGDLLLHDDVP